MISRGYALEGEADNAVEPGEPACEPGPGLFRFFQW